MDDLQIKETKKRKRRSDRTHVLYLLTNIATQETYVGMTVKNGPVMRSIDERWKRHVHRALNETRSWKLCQSIRTHGAESFKREVIKTVRGKAVAHRVERELIAELKPTLNTF